jgi:hypothetical protein
MESPPPKRQKKETKAKSTSDKKRPATFLDLPSEITQKIIHPFFSIRENHVGDTRAPITHTVEDLSYDGDILGPGRRDTATISEHPRINHCRLKVLNIMTSCSKLYLAGLEVLLQQNKFVAIRGADKSLTTWLKTFGITSYWTPPWAGRWNKDTGCWMVNNAVFCPELTINFPNCDISQDGPVLVPIEDLETLVLALTLSLLKKDVPCSNIRQIELIIKGISKASVYGATPGTTLLDILREKVLFWIGRWVLNVSITQGQTQLGDSLGESNDFVPSMRRECDHQREVWDSAGLSLGRAIYRHLRKFVLEVETLTNMEETEKAFLAMGRLEDQVYCVNESWLQKSIPGQERLRLDRIVAYGGVRLGALENPQCFGTSPQRFWIALVEQLKHISFHLHVRRNPDPHWKTWVPLRLAELRLRANLDIQDIYQDLEDSAWRIAPSNTTHAGGQTGWAVEMLRDTIPDYGRWIDYREEDWGNLHQDLRISEWATPPSKAPYESCMAMVDLLKQEAEARFGPLGNLESQAFDQEAAETAS